MRHWLHLARRFVGSLQPRGPTPADAAWAESQLLPGEDALWVAMSGVDRRHAAGVARDVVARLGAAATRPVVAAALLHDSGKAVSGLGTLARVPATLVGMTRHHSAVGGRFGDYLRHDALGADRLAAAGSDPLTVAWAREHHLPSSRWSVPPTIANALKAADDD